MKVENHQFIERMGGGVKNEIKSSVSIDVFFEVMSISTLISDQWTCAWLTARPLRWTASTAEQQRGREGRPGAAEQQHLEEKRVRVSLQAQRRLQVSLDLTEAPVPGAAGPEPRRPAPEGREGDLPGGGRL